MTGRCMIRDCRRPRADGYALCVQHERAYNPTCSCCPRVLTDASASSGRGMCSSCWWKTRDGKDRKLHELNLRRVELMRAQRERQREEAMS